MCRNSCFSRNEQFLEGTVVVDNVSIPINVQIKAYLVITPKLGGVAPEIIEVSFFDL